MGKDIKTSEDFLKKIVEAHELSESHIEYIEKVKQKAIDALKNAFDDEVSIIVGGSVVRGTAIKESPDIDIALNFPPDKKENIKQLYEKVGKIVKKKLKKPDAKGIGWESSYKKDLHVSVLPGIKVENDSGFAYYYDKNRDKIVETNIQTQTQSIQEHDRGDLIKLIKTWKERRDIPVPSFLLEQYIVRGVKGMNRNHLEKQTNAFFKSFKHNLNTIKITDPANQNNSLSDLLTQEQKEEINEAIQEALEAKTWNKVFKK